jgi:hypothetical protein
MLRLLIVDELCRSCSRASSGFAIESPMNDQTSSQYGNPILNELVSYDEIIMDRM